MIEPGKPLCLLSATTGLPLMSTATSLSPGFIALHGNRTEWLLDAVAAWLVQHPLAPLEPEVILVQSNGMAEWVKMALAREAGVCAAATVQLPARFQWQIYRQVLGRHQVPLSSPFDKTPLTWRLMRMLPHAAPRSGFEPIADYLAGGDAMRCFQLASRIADLFDQYQVHRPDWLEAWAGGDEILRNAGGQTTALPDDQCWQARLWQALLAELEPEQQGLTRAALHTRVLQALSSTANDAMSPDSAYDPGHPHAAHDSHPAGRLSGLPRRVVLFGMTHVPRPTLELLAALAAHCQVVLAVPNPCRFHWADAIDGRQWLRSQRRRLPLRDTELADVTLEAMHLHAHPLLAAWGRQARDFIRQLDDFDDASQTREQFPQARIDLFEEDVPANATLLHQVQCHIRDLVPLAEHPGAQIPASDRSIEFHIAHNPVRELEVLHDRLLDRLANATAEAPLRPRDIVVMVPAIDEFAPAIRAVFGQYGRHDPRHIPFDIADLSARANSPLLHAVQWLLALPQDRCRLSELGGLLDVPAIAARFGLAEGDTPRLIQWMEGAGIRWGLDAEHRADLGLAACGDTNTVLFGLRRMLMGFAVGQSPALSGPPFAHIEPHDEVGGLEAGLAGALARLVEGLLQWHQSCRLPASPDVWLVRLRELLAAFVKPASDDDRQMLAALERALEAWAQACDDAGFNAELPIDVVGDAWLDILETPALDQRFRAGGVTFCTLMPMRAIPFEVVCLLGMNDGDYPRRAPRSDFDLMALPGMQRPGDRARRDDDRQLMLEALLSARQALHASWCGRNVRDNTEQPPSVLITQLRDYLADGWGEEIVVQRTVEHPLQPFSRRYFELDSPLITYAREWRAAHDSPSHPPPPASGATPARQADTMTPASPGPAAFCLPRFEPDPDVPLTVAALARFLRNPVADFFQQRLGVMFREPDDALPDEETFVLAGLERFEQMQEIIDNVLAACTALISTPVGADHVMPDEASIWSAIDRELDRARGRGDLPLGGPGLQEMQTLRTTLGNMMKAWVREREWHPLTAERRSLRFEHEGLCLADWLYQPLQASDDATPIWLEVRASQLGQRQRGKTRGGEAADPLAQLRGQHLLRPWLLSLLSSAAGQPCGGRLIGKDATLVIAPMSADAEDEARRCLTTVLEGWCEGMTEPLPVVLRTALAALQDIHALDANDPVDPQSFGKARQAYEGNEFDAGQPVDLADLCLARCFPSYDALASHPRFLHWVRTLYAPMREWAEQHVSIEPHVETDASEATVVAESGA